MPLILAIEPDRRQSSKLIILARNQLHADLVVATSVDQALACLEEQIPDLLLTSPLIPAKDALALADRLRELDAEGLRVQTVTIPMLTVPGHRLRQPQKGAAAPAKGRSLSQVAAGGCDPVVFGVQLSTHLERAAADGSAERAAARARQPRAEAAASTLKVLSHPAIAASTALDSLMTQAEDDELAEAGGTAQPDMPDEETVSPDLDPGDWTDVLAAMRRDIEDARSAAQQAIGIMSADAALDQAEPLIPTTVPGVEGTLPEESSARFAAVDPPPSDPPADAGQDAPRKKRRKPRQDEWGFFDPDRCGVSALISKVNETTGGPRNPSKKTS
jgi:hypothetical protein